MTSRTAKVERESGQTNAEQLVDSFHLQMRPHTRVFVRAVLRAKVLATTPPFSPRRDPRDGKVISGTGGTNKSDDKSRERYCATNRCFERDNPELSNWSTRLTCRSDVTP